MGRRQLHASWCPWNTSKQRNPAVDRISEAKAKAAAEAAAKAAKAAHDAQAKALAGDAAVKAAKAAHDAQVKAAAGEAAAKAVRAAAEAKVKASQDAFNVTVAAAKAKREAELANSIQKALKTGLSPNVPYGGVSPGDLALKSIDGIYGPHASSAPIRTMTKPVGAAGQGIDNLMSSALANMKQFDQAAAVGRSGSGGASAPTSGPSRWREPTDVPRSASTVPGRTPASGPHAKPVTRPSPNPRLNDLLHQIDDTNAVREAPSVTKPRDLLARPGSGERTPDRHLLTLLDAVPRR